MNNLATIARLREELEAARAQIAREAESLARDYVAPTPAVPATTPVCRKCTDGRVSSNNPVYAGFYYCDCPAGVALRHPPTQTPETP